MVRTRNSMKREPVYDHDEFMVGGPTSLPQRAAQLQEGLRRSSYHSESPSPDQPLQHQSTTSIATIIEGDDSATGVNRAVDTPMQNSDGNATKSLSVDTDASSEVMHSLGQRSRRLIQVIQKLEALCISSALGSLPKFVVVGDQSAGKSSIIEAICDIKLPRGSGTCTRCPFQITTTAAKHDDTKWICKVILQRKYALTLSHDGSDKWTQQDSLNTFHFATISDKALLDNTLRRAQLAILNPNKDPSVFSNMANVLDESTRLEFSPNVVSLEIEAPGLPDLSFYDLPGAINVHELGHDHFVGFVEKLIKSYVRDEKALIMLACSADQDVDNSTAFKYIRDGNTQSNSISRTIGVLTKPDLVGGHRLPAIRRILNGETFRLKAWFVSKQLSQEELDNESGISHATARARELQFFAGDPWNTRLVEFSHAFGIVNLQNHISRELSAHILHELPEIVSRVARKLAEVNDKLALFPKAPDSAMHTVFSEVQTLTNSIINHVKGHESNNQFLDTWRLLFRNLRIQLKNVRLQVDLKSPDYVPSTIEIEDDEQEEESTPAPKARKGNNGRPVPSTPQRQIHRGTPRSVSMNTDGTSDSIGSSAKAPKLTLDDIQRTLNAGSNSGLPDVVDPKALDSFIRVSNKCWPLLVEHLFKEIKVHVQRMLREAINEHLSARLKTQFHHQVSQIVDEFSNELFDSQSQCIEHILRCQSVKAITYNDELMSEYKRMTRKKLEDGRNEQRLSEYFDENKLKVPQKGDWHKHIEKLGPDAYSRELDAMTVVLAYYDISSLHLIDAVAKQLQFGLLLPLETKLNEKLWFGLRVSDDTYCAQLLAENPEREAERLRLLDERQRLTTAFNELEALPKLAED